MNNVVAEDAADREFRRRGYVMRPFLDAAEVDALTRLHELLPPEVATDFYATVFSRDAGYRRRVSDGIGAIMAGALARHFPGHELCFALFVTKRPMTRHGKLPLHRDYSFVDQSVHTAVHIWIPLIDVDETNGCLQVVPGSHTLMPSPFAVNEYPSPFHPVLDLLDREFTVRVPMRAGSVLAYESRLLHGSGENRSDQLRPACIAILLPAGIDPRVYVWDGTRPTRFDVLNVTRDFLLELERGAPIRPPYPPGVSYLTSADYPVDALQPKDLARLRDV